MEINKRRRDKWNKEIVTNKYVNPIATIPIAYRVQQNEQCRRRYVEKKDRLTILERL